MHVSVTYAKVKKLMGETCDHKIGYEFDWDDGVTIIYSSDSVGPFGMVGFWEEADMFKFCPDCGVELPGMDEGHDHEG